MNASTYQLAATMVNQLNRVDTISNNLANLNTNGFKQEHLVEGSFNNYLKSAKHDNSNLDKMNILSNTIPKIDGKFITSSVGSIQTTGNQLDFSLTKPDTYFKIQNPQGEIEYTRDGAFKNLNGTLVNGNGNPVLGAGNEPLIVEEGFESLIGVVKIDSTNLEKIGNNNYRVKEARDIEFVDETDGEFMQGSLEKSNINSVVAMVELIEAQRRFEQAQKAMTSKSELNQKLIDKIGSGK